LIRLKGIKWTNSNFRKAVLLLEKPAQIKLGVVTAFQVVLGFLDLLGIGAIGILGALTVTGIQSKEPGNRVAQALKFLHIEELSFQNQVSILGFVAVLLLFSRTIVSVILMRRVLYFLSNKSAYASAGLIRSLLQQPLTSVQSKSSQETLYAVTNGVSTLLIGVVGTFVNMASDFLLLVILITGLVIIDPSMTIGMILFFSFVSFILYRASLGKVRTLAQKNISLTISSSEKLLEVISTYREAVVRDRRKYYADFIAQTRYQLSDVIAENSFIPYINKYIIELTIIASALIMSSIQFYYYDAPRAIGTLTLFLAAGLRIAPATLRIQQGFLTIKSSLTSAQPTLDLIDKFGKDQPTQIMYSNINNDIFTPIVKVSNLSFSYKDSNTSLLSDISFECSPGSVTAITGPSGAGKSTLVDLILGIHIVDKPSISISGVDPRTAVSKWPGKIGYAPQNTVIIQGSIRQNIALGFDKNEIIENNIKYALEVAHLDTFVSSLPNGLDTQVGENGARLSGGQRQRLGIARAMYTSPELLILDESTSSLDGETEVAISDSLQELGKDVTVIIIAHRLSTVKTASQVVYIENGKLIAKGPFNSVREQIPNFDNEAKLFGL